MAVLALNTASYRNAVSRLHRQVSQEMFHDLWPQLPQWEVPITSVTNGVHLPSWLNGELASLYDQYLPPDWRERFNEGVAGLVANLDYWDYREKWSWYGSHGYLCPPHYHKLNYLLLSILGELTGEEVLTRRARSWDVNAKGRLDRMEIYLVYLITQNAARLRLPRQ